MTLDEATEILRQHLSHPTREIRPTDEAFATMLRELRDLREQVRAARTIVQVLEGERDSLLAQLKDLHEHLTKQAKVFPTHEAGMLYAAAYMQQIFHISPWEDAAQQKAALHCAHCSHELLEPTLRCPKCGKRTGLM